MAKPTLSMSPTGWFQVAWAAEVQVGQVHRMHYFGRELIAWRGNSGKVTVMDAYCEHLGAHLGHGGTVVEDTIQCPFHGWQWNDKGRNVCIPYEDRPNIGKKIKTYPTAEANEAIYMWHDTERREPFFDVPDVFTAFDDEANADPADYWPAHPGATMIGEKLELHPQYVIENGVDFAHFKYVHKVPIIPVFTRHDFDEPTSYVDFTITFDGEMKDFNDVNSGVNAVNGGIGVAVTRSWGMFDHRTATAVTPVDDSTCDIRFSVWVARHEVKTDDPEKAAAIAGKLAYGVIEQVEHDIVIWKHQKYADPAALARGEYAGFTALRKWAEQFYPETEAAATPLTTSAN